MKYSLLTTLILIIACVLEPCIASPLAASGESDQKDIAVTVKGGKLWIDVENESLEHVLSTVATRAGIGVELQGDLTRTVSFIAQGESVEVVLRLLIEDESIVMEFERAAGTEAGNENATRLVRFRVYANHGARDGSGLSTEVDRTKLLRERLVSEDQAHLKPHAIDELAEIGSEKATDVLLETMQDQAPEVRARIIDAFVRIGGFEGPRALGESLSLETEAALRAEALDGLRFLGTVEAAQVLEEARNNSHDDVRSGAELALDDLGL